MATSDGVREAFEAWVKRTLPEHQQGIAYRSVAWLAYRHAHRAGKVAGMREAAAIALRTCEGPDEDRWEEGFTAACEYLHDRLNALAAKEEA